MCCEQHLGDGSVVVDFLLIVTPIAGVCNCFMFCCTLLYVHSSIAIILMVKRELVAWLNLSCWCLVMVERLFLAVPWGCLRFVIVVIPDHTHLLFLLHTNQLFICWVMFHVFVFFCLQKYPIQINLPLRISEILTVCIQIRMDVQSVLVCAQTLNLQRLSADENVVSGRERKSCGFLSI